MKKIAFLTSSHLPLDDRIFYHLARSLSEHGFSVEIISSQIELRETKYEIDINSFDSVKLSRREKINHFIQRLLSLNPDLIISSEPITILAAFLYSGKVKNKIKIIFDITEWFPSKKDLRKHHFTVRWIFFLLHLFSNFITSILADGFIFGEWYKSRPYRFFFPRKPFVDLPYYPDLRYINYLKPEIMKSDITLSYSGKISREKGFERFTNVAMKVASRMPDLRINIDITGWYEDEVYREKAKEIYKAFGRNIFVNYSEVLPYEQYNERIKRTNIFIDLRSDDLENQHCLPIRLFLFAAAGRPVIFTRLKAIRHELNISDFGFLVDPADSERITSIITDYINNPDIYLEHCLNARSLAETKCNWKKIEGDYIAFINRLTFK